MTFEKILDLLSFDNITLKSAYELMQEKDKLKTINYFINRDKITKEPLKDSEISQLTAIVNILQILYTSKTGSPIADDKYDILQETLVNLGIPRLTGSMEINDNSKISHKYTNLRGSIDKVYYLFSDEKRINKSQKYLDEWISKVENTYYKNTGKKINLNNEKVILQPKMDGISVLAEVEDKKITWITRGDTGKNRASDVSHIMDKFDDLYSEYKNSGIKFEVMCTEENLANINRLLPKDERYKNSRAVAVSALNANEPDFKSDYLYPVPLRISKENQEREEIHPDLITEFPSEICLLSERDKIKKYANENKYVFKNGMRFRTDGVVITILNPEIQKALGRKDDINNWEVAYKFTAEIGYSTIKDCEFYVSEFGFITPVLVFNDIIMKGNTVKKVSLSNKERFDELEPRIGDKICIHYDIIPVITIDENCKKNPVGRKIEFTKTCPSCNYLLDLNVTQVQCQNSKCSSKIIGKILNYCNNLRIQNIGYQTLESLYDNGFLNKGIRSLYKLKKKLFDIEGLEGFGKLKTRKIISEIESKRILKDYEFFGSIGIEGLSIKTFQSIFYKIPYKEFLNLIFNKDFSTLLSKLIMIDGIGEKKAILISEHYKDKESRIELEKLVEELAIQETYNQLIKTKGKILFTGFRSQEFASQLEKKGWNVVDSFTNDISYLIIKDKNISSSKLSKAKEKGIKILTYSEAINNIEKL